jgi:putative SOS response-associated peptidase YedK
MCGRFAQSSDSKRLAKAFKVAEVPELEPCFNIAPTQDILAVYQSPDGPSTTFYKWGLIPSWAKDTSMGARLINARSETVTEKPAFRQAFRQRRCIIPADGFYEWQKREGSKQPFFFRMRDESPFGFAGLWERWEGGEGNTEEGNPVESCTILTTEANDLLRPVHDRMPVILHPEEYSLWLEGSERETQLLKELLRPFPASEMTGHPVSTNINNPRSHGAALIEQVRLNSA